MATCSVCGGAMLTERPHNHGVAGFDPQPPMTPDERTTEPTTAAGQRMLAWLDSGDPPPNAEQAILAIEAEARAGALDEARAAVEGVSVPDTADAGWIVAQRILATIDALREDANKP